MLANYERGGHEPMICMLLGKRCFFSLDFLPLLWTLNKQSHLGYKLELDFILFFRSYDIRWHSQKILRYKTLRKLFILKLQCLELFKMYLDSPGFARRRRVSPLNISYLNFVVSRGFEIIRTIILVSKWLLEWYKKSMFNLLLIRKDMVFWWRIPVKVGETS